MGVLPVALPGGGRAAGLVRRGGVCRAEGCRAEDCRAEDCRAEDCRAEAQARGGSAVPGFPARGRLLRGTDLAGVEKRRPQGLLSAHRRHQRPQHRSGPGRGRGPHAFPQGGALGPGAGRGAEEPGHGQALERQRAQDRQTVDPGGGTAAATAVGPGPGGGSRGSDPDSPSQLRQGGGTESHPQEGALPPGRHHRGRTHQRPGHFRHSSQAEGGGDPLAATGSQGPSGRDRSPGGGCQPEFPAGHRDPVGRALRAAVPATAAGGLEPRPRLQPLSAAGCCCRRGRSRPPWRGGRG